MTQTKDPSLRWWQQTICYEIYVKSYKDTNGDGIGDLKGITEELDYIKSLGVGAIWLTPCYKSPQADNGYDIADYYDIEPAYGTMEDMDTLLAEAKKRDIRIVMDLVFNHTSNEHQWFLDSCARKNGKDDWYIWRDAKPDGSVPNNWRGIFGGSAWTWCEERGQYYLHTFLPEQPDINWANPEVRRALYDVANFWVKKGVGGFRMDAITYLKKSDFVDATPDGLDGMSGIHYATANTEGILDYLHEFRANVQDGTDIFTVGEANGVTPADLPLWVGDKGVFSMVFEFAHVVMEFQNETNWAETKDWTLPDLKKVLSDSQATTATNGWYPIFFENHDQPRTVDRFFPADKDPVKAGKAMGTILYTLRGTPFLYQGEELGYQNVSWDDISCYDDISSRNQYKFLIGEGYTKEQALAAIHQFSRDSGRTPMQWNSDKQAGFTTGTPWLPIHDNYTTCNVASESADPDSVLSWYRKLAALRQEHPALIKGSYRELLVGHEQIFAYERRCEEETLVVMVNFSTKEAFYELPELAEATEILNSEATTTKDDLTKGCLAPLQAAIYRIV